LNGDKECPDCKVSMKFEREVRNARGWLVAIIWKCLKCGKRFNDYPVLHEIGAQRMKETYEKEGKP